MTLYTPRAIETPSTYTPSITDTLNVDSSTAFVTGYLRVGSQCIVSGRVDVDPTSSATRTQIDITLPVASTFANAEECGGSFSSIRTTSNVSGVIYADVASGKARFDWVVDFSTNTSHYFCFMYQII